MLGDARLTLNDAGRGYDVIVVDAQSSDSIPIHLMTREALALPARLRREASSCFTSATATSTLHPWLRVGAGFWPAGAAHALRADQPGQLESSSAEVVAGQPGAILDDRSGNRWHREARTAAWIDTVRTFSAGFGGAEAVRRPILAKVTTLAKPRAAP